MLQNFYLYFFGLSFNTVGLLAVALLDRRPLTSLFHGHSKVTAAVHQTRNLSRHVVYLFVRSGVAFYEKHRFLLLYNEDTAYCTAARTACYLSTVCCKVQSLLSCLESVNVRFSDCSSRCCWWSTMRCRAFCPRSSSSEFLSCLQFPPLVCGVPFHPRGQHTEAKLVGRKTI